MTLKLEALSPAEGFGFIRSEGELRLVRPPFRAQDALVLSDESLHDAIARFGYTVSDRQFDNWEDVITFLNQQIVETRRVLELPIPEVIAGSEILDVAPPEVLNKFMARVEEELIPQGLFDEAEDFLLALLETSAADRTPEVGDRAVRLLQVNRDRRRRSEAAITEFTAHDIRFPSLERHGEVELSARMAEIIRGRGCVFAPTS